MTTQTFYAAQCWECNSPVYEESEKPCPDCGAKTVCATCWSCWECGRRRGGYV